MHWPRARICALLSGPACLPDIRRCTRACGRCLDRLYANDFGPTKRADIEHMLLDRLTSKVALWFAIGVVDAD